MFHVKLSNNPAVGLGSASHGRRASREFWPVAAWVGMTAATQILLALASSPAQAAIHKGIAADGKVALSDPPCVAGQAAATVQPAAASATVPNLPNAGNAPGGVVVNIPGAAARATTQGTMRAAQTRACCALGGRFAGFKPKGVREGADALAKPVFDQHEPLCAGQVRTAPGAGNARNEGRQKQSMVGEECKEMRRVLGERRPLLASLSSDDKKAFAAVESEVVRVSR